MNRTQDKKRSIQDSFDTKTERSPSLNQAVKIKQKSHVEVESWYEWFRITGSYGDQERSVEL